MKRVYCLYRVSSKKQVDTNDNKNDIPMQKQACHEFATRQGWEIVAEQAELGVSGFKVSAKDRDAIQDIQKAAAEKKFDVLLCFMFDRIGRIDSETPFVVEWFINNGIEVWSVNEGQQRLDSHTDKLLNYIRYWQASGESIKTSIRTKTSISQIAQKGLYHGGSISFGYRLVKKGRINKKGYDIHDLEINPHEAEYVKLVYEKYVYKGMGYLTISNFLTERGIYNRKGERITFAAVRHMLMSPLYTGVMVCGDVQSEFIPELQIIDNDLFLQAQQLRENRANALDAKKDAKAKRAAPINVRGLALLAGNAYCAACGGKLYLSYGGYDYTRKKDGVMVRYQRIRYNCNNKTRKLRDCNGQTGYVVKKLDGLITEFLLGLFQNIKGAVESDMVDKSYQSELQSLKVKLKGASVELHKHAESLKTLQGEVVKAIQGESKFDSAVLNDLIAQTKDKIQSSTEKVNRYQHEFDNRQQHLSNIQADYKKLVSWAEIFQDSTPETKKMITAYLIKSVTVSRGYKVDITFNVAFEQFFSAV